MMAFDQIRTDDIADKNVRDAVSSLVQVSSWGNSYLVTTPLAYPSGTIVGVRVIPAPREGGYWVSDFAMGFREAEAYEAQRSFGAHAGRMKDELGVEYTDGHELRLFAREWQVAWAIRKVSYATQRVAVKTYHTAPAWDEQSMGAALYQRLRDLFGAEHVEPAAKITGSSNLSWKFAAQVSTGDRRVLFDVVTPYHTSVFSAVSKFTDVRRIGPTARPVAVVSDLEKMGKWLPLISQEAEVIEGDASEETLRSVVSEAA